MGMGNGEWGMGFLPCVPCALGIFLVQPAPIHKILFSSFSKTILDLFAASFSVV